MFDFKSHYAIVKSVIMTKAKEEHKPSLDNKASMAAYAKAVSQYDKTVLGKANFMPAQSDDVVIDYVV